MTDRRVPLNLEITPEMDRLLNGLAEKINGTKVDVLRKGVAFVKVALDAQASGQSIGITDAPGQLMTQIVVR